MNKLSKLLILGVLGLFLILSFIGYQTYKIPKLVGEDYDCNSREGIISYSNPFPFESRQHYVNRLNDAVIMQIEEVC